MKTKSHFLIFFLFYQVQSAVFTLIYNLPDRLSISPMNWTYATEELDLDKLSILQNLVFMFSINK
jgi:hypothetical protein